MKEYLGRNIVVNGDVLPIEDDYPEIEDREFGESSNVRMLAKNALSLAQKDIRIPRHENVRRMQSKGSNEVRRPRDFRELQANDDTLLD